MKNKIFANILIGITIINASAAYASDKVLVVFRNPKVDRVTASFFTNKKEMNRMKAQTLASYSGARVVETYDAISDSENVVFALLDTNGKDPDEFVAELRKRGDIVSAKKSMKVHTMARTPNDPGYASIWGMHAIKADEAWEETTGSDDVFVAIIDSGSAIHHEDLDANFENAGLSYNFITDDPYLYGDGNGHGTHVSGIIGAAGDNGIGVVGVNWKTRLISLRVLDGNGEGEDADLVKAMDRVLEILDENPDLKLASVNLSLGGYSEDDPSTVIANNDPLWIAFNAVSKTDRTIICVAAGNETNDIGTPNMYGYCYPAAFEGIENMIVVGAAEKRGDGCVLAKYSNYNTEKVHIIAPGSGILSTWPYGQYQYLDGTSMATPFVTGTAALLKSAFPSACASDIKEAICEGANHSAFMSYSKYGFLDVKAALDKLREISNREISPDVRTTSVSNGIIGLPYKSVVTIKGSGTVSYSVVSGKLPDGLAISNNAQGFVLEGTPEKLGTFSFTIKATNYLGSVTKEYTMVIGKAPVISNDIPEVAEYTSTTVKLNGEGLEPLRWEISSTDKLTISSDGTLIIPSLPRGEYTAKVKLTSLGKVSNTKDITVKVLPVPQVSFPENLAGTVGVDYEYTFTANASELKWEMKNLPNGLTFDSKEGKISGKPSLAGEYTVSVAASNSIGKSSQEVAFKVIDTSPAITTEDLGYAVVGVNYSKSLASSGTGKITWNITGLPKGLIADANGNISGIPTEMCAQDVQVTAANTGGSISKNFSFRVYAKPEITTNVITNAVAGKDYEFKLTANGSPNFTWKASGLPEGLYVTDDGYIRGVTSKVGGHFITLTVSNSVGSDISMMAMVVTNKYGGNTDVSVGVETMISYINEILRIFGISKGVIPLANSTGTAGNPRSISSFSSEELTRIENDMVKIAAILPDITVEEDGFYLVSADIKESIPVGYAMDLEMFTKESASAARVAVADTIFSMFMNSSGTEISNVPENRIVWVVMELKKGTIYSPVITAKYSSEADDYENNESDGEGEGGGCNTSGIGIFSMILLPLLKRKKKSNF